MPNEESDLEYVAPPEAGRLKPAQGAGAAPAPQYNFAGSAAARVIAGLLLAAFCLYLLLPTGSKPLPDGETFPDGQVTSGGLPEQEAQGPAGGLRAQSLTAPLGGGQEEGLAPPAPGLLMAPLSLDTVSYTGPAQSPALLVKETAEDRAGCKVGDMLKCLRLGGRYFAGHGVERDAVRGFALINRACAGGIAEACTTQGIMQLTGQGTARDVPAGIALCDRACSAGDMFGCSMLGGIYLEGKDMPADLPRAIGLLRKACEAKIGVSCSLLGMMFAEGKGLPRDPAMAEQLFGEACALGEKPACALQQQLVQIRIGAGNKR